MSSSDPSGEQEVVRIYRQSLDADALFSQKDYIKAANAYINRILALQEAFRRDPNTQWYVLPVGSDELRAARHFFGADYGPIEKNGIAAGFYAELMQTMLGAALQIAGCDAPVCPLSLSVPPDDEIIARAFSDMVNVVLPPTDGDWEAATGKLELAALKIKAVLGRRPELGDESVARFSWQNATGAEALYQVRQKVSDARRGSDEANARQGRAIPPDVEYDLAFAREQIGPMIPLAQEGEFLNAREAERFVANRAQYVEELMGRWQAAYGSAGQTMTEGVINPIVVLLDALENAVNDQAPRNTFPADAPHDEALEKSVRNQIARSVPEAHVLQTAMDDATWEIAKNEWDVPLYRRKGGWVLYQLPGEKWARLYHVIFQQTYAGGGVYEPGDGADSFGLLRWQQATPPLPETAESEI